MSGRTSWETGARLLGAIARPRVTGLLDAAATRPVVLVEAPAGHGKTVAVQQWVGAPSGPPGVAWVDLGRASHDPDRFVDELVGAVGAVLDQGPPSGPLPARPHVEDRLDARLDALGRSPSDVTVVLDRVDAAGAEVVALVRRVVEHLPPSWHVVLTSRSTPAIGVARLRAALALSTIGADDLRFDVEEAGALLRGGLGLDVGDRVVADLTARLGGWAAGLVLAGLGAQRHPDPEAALNEVSGRHPWIDDYFTTEVLPTIDDDLRRFLVRTAALPRLTPQLCNAVTGEGDAAAHLETLRPWSAVTVQSTPTGVWTVLDEVFRDWVLALAWRTSPDDVPAASVAAARWFQQQGQFEDALAQALAIGTPALVLELLADRGYDLARRAPHLVHEGLATLPAEAVVDTPEVWLLAADAAAARGDGLRVSILTDRARAAAPGLEGGRASALRRGVAMLDLWWYLHHGHVTEAGRLVSVLVPPVPDRPPGVMMHAGWDPGRARFLSDLTSYLAGAQHAGRSMAVRALLACHQDDAASARTLAWRALAGDDVGPGDGTDLMLAALALAWSGNESDVAHADDLAGTVATSTRWWLVDHLRALVAVESARRDHRWRTARQHLDRAHAVLDEVADPGVVPGLLLVHATGRLEEQAADRATALTEREVLVLRHLATSQSRREIARRLHLSQNTVKTHLRSAYRKLGVASRAEAIDRAQRTGVLGGAPPPAAGGSSRSSNAEW